jgi:aminopeptidase N
MKRLALFAAVAVAWSAPPALAAGPSPGAPGLGDRLAPLLGNGGYDVDHYDLEIRYATSAPSQPIEGTATILARATQSLSRFNLDFAGASVGSVSVDGAVAAFRRDGEELVITPRKALRHGERFVVQVKRFVAVPTVPGEDPSTQAFMYSGTGSFTAPQPYYAHFIYPSNDHPRDKATFTFRIDAPAGATVAASGIPIGPLTHRGRSQWVFVQRQPMATELTQLTMGSWRVTSPGRRHGVLLRDLTPPATTEALRPKLALQPGHFDWIEPRVGRYPFDAYGTLAADADFGFLALETQTLTIFNHEALLEGPQGLWEPTMMHELAHSWFGNSVSPYEWSDLWLNEGHASWYEFLFAEERGQLEVDTEFWPDEQGYATLVELMRAIYAHGDEWRRDFGPVARPHTGTLENLFSFQAYHGGSLVLYALRQKIGHAAFARVERAWVDRYRDRSVSTGDWIDHVVQVTGRRDLRDFLVKWLYGMKTPPMPGHPDWTVNPAPTMAPLAQTVAPRARRR